MHYSSEVWLSSWLRDGDDMGVMQGVLDFLYIVLDCKVPWALLM